MTSSNLVGKPVMPRDDQSPKVGCGIIESSRLMRDQFRQHFSFGDLMSCLAHNGRFKWVRVTRFSAEIKTYPSISFVPSLYLIDLINQFSQLSNRRVRIVVECIFTSYVL